MSNISFFRNPTGSFPSKVAFWLKLAGVAAVVVLALSVSVGIGQSPSPRPSDDVLQLRVQSAIQNDSVLKTHKLILLVNVVDRQAVISGPIPEAALAERIETVSKNVPGIAAVRMSVWVPTSLVPDDPLSKKVNELMKAEAAKPAGNTMPTVNLKPTAEPPFAAPPATTAKPVDVPPSVVAPKPAGVAPPAPPFKAPSAEDTRPVGKVTSNKGPDGLLLDPVAPTGTGFRPTPLAPGAAPLPYTTIPPPNVPLIPPQVEPEAPRRNEAVPVAAPPAVTAKGSQLDELRKDPRFAGLKLTIEDGVAVISGRPLGGSERTWALAQAVRKLPGVERVIVRQP